MKYFDKISNEKIKNWFREHALDEEHHFQITYDTLLQNGFKYSNGLFFKSLLTPKDEKALNYSVFEILTFRPLDLHLRTDVDELFVVLSGYGAAYLSKNSSETQPDLEESSLFPNAHLFVPKNHAQTLSPEPSDPLYLRVFCSGIWSPQGEKTLSPFYEFEPWNMRYSHLKKE